MIVCVKLTPTELRALDQLVSLANFESRSAAIREALGMLFKEFNVKGDTLRAIRLERLLHTSRRRQPK